MTRYDNILWGDREPRSYHLLLENLISAVRNLKGAQRADVAGRMPWDVAQELIDLGHAVATPVGDPASLDNDEDFQRRLRAE